MQTAVLQPENKFTIESHHGILQVMNTSLLF